MKFKFYLFVSLLLAFLASCTQDSMDEDLANNDVTLEQLLEEAGLSDEALACYDAEGSGIVPNGECLIGAIVKAGEQFGIHWNAAGVKYAVDNFLHEPYLDINGERIGNPSDPRSIARFLKTFFDASQVMLLDNSFFTANLGKGFTGIGIVKNYDEQNSGHAYTILGLCNKHKNDCYICYDPVAGCEVHLKRSEFAYGFTFILGKPKTIPNLEDNF